MKETPLPALDLVKLCCHALGEKKAVDVRVLDVSEQSSITDYLVIATGTSDPHLRTLRVELEKVIDATKTRMLGMETVQESGWFVIDAFDVMIHIFNPDTREKYGLENLWKDAAEVSLAEKPVPKRKTKGGKLAKRRDTKKENRRRKTS